MSIQYIKMETVDGSMFSPFTGLPATSDEGANANDPSLIFAYYGNAGMYDSNLEETMEKAEIDEDVDPTEIESGVDLIFEVDTGFDGVNYYGYKQVQK